MTDAILDALSSAFMLLLAALAIIAFAFIAYAIMQGYVVVWLEVPSGAEKIVSLFGAFFLLYPVLYLFALIITLFATCVEMVGSIFCRKAPLEKRDTVHRLRGDARVNLLINLLAHMALVAVWFEVFALMRYCVIPYFSVPLVWVKTASFFAAFLSLGVAGFLIMVVSVLLFALLFLIVSAATDSFNQH